LQMSFYADFRGGSVSVNCETNRLESNEDLIALHNRALDIAKTGLDLITFATGRPYIIIFDKYTDKDNETKAFSLSQDDIAAFCTAVKPGDVYLQVFQLLISEPPIFYALRDLVEAISTMRRVPINCARVVDTLRHQMTPNGSPASSWAAMRSSLQISEPYLKFITDHSKGWRHGNYEIFPTGVMQDLTQRTWIIMDRYIEFRKRGKGQLPLSEFPFLV